MNQEFVPYEIAVKLKHLGFDERCIGIYINGDNLYACWQPEREVGKQGFGSAYNSLVSDEGNYGYIKPTAPMYQQVFRWFRKKYDLYGVPEEIFVHGTQCFSFTIGGKLKYESMESYNSYENAELACIQKLIELISHDNNQR